LAEQCEQKSGLKFGGQPTSGHPNWKAKQLGLKLAPKFLPDNLESQNKMDHVTSKEAQTVQLLVGFPQSTRTQWQLDFKEVTPPRCCECGEIMTLVALI
jgi:hypothetical protein